jgi:hypothetical protein
LTLREPLTLILTDKEINDTSFFAKSFEDALVLGFGGNRLGIINITSTLAEINVTKTSMFDGQELQLGENAEFEITFHRTFSQSDRNSNFTYITDTVMLLERLARSGERFDLDYTVYSQGVVLPLTCDEGLIVMIPYDETLQRYFEVQERDVNSGVLKSSANGTFDIVACDKYAVKFNNCDVLLHNLTSLLEDKESGKSLSEPYVIIGDQVYVCVHGAETFLLHKSNVSPILTLVGITFSLVFMALNLLLHMMIKALRTLPGLMLMNLCGVLFTAQLLFITAINRVTDNAACFAMAMIIHYFWLATFFWMNAIAVNMAWTFSRGFMDAGNTGNRRLALASSYAYGTPIVIVLICGLLDKFSGVRIGYGPGPSEEGPCWFTERGGLIYGFILPVGLIITANLCLFIITTVSISKARRISKAATGSLFLNEKYLKVA